jgi:hypothetical protein
LHGVVLGSRKKNSQILEQLDGSSDTSGFLKEGYEGKIIRFPSYNGGDIHD